jgi:prepilin peptidase CpaA
MVFYGILITLLLVAVFTDIRKRRIPNWLTCSAVVVAMLYHGGAEGISGFIQAIEGLTLGMALLLPFYAAGGMGAGDVKLMGAVGALLGPKGVFIAFIFSALAGGVYALVLIVAMGRLRDVILHYAAVLGFFYCTGTVLYESPAVGEKPVLCYAVAIAAGTFVSRAQALLW